MKKILVIGAAVVALLALLGFGYTNLAYAQDDQPLCPFCGEGEWNRGRGGFQGQMAAGEYGPMHEYLHAALAEAFGMTPEALEAAHDGDQTLWEIAQDQGVSVEAFQALVQEARAAAFEQMAADGVISQEQAERMSGRMFGGRGQGGAVSGDCGMYGAEASGTYGPGMRGGGRWQNQP